MPIPYEEIKREVAVGTRLLADLGLANGLRHTIGHVSLRVPDDPNLFVVKGRGYRLDTLSKMQPEDMVVVDMDGNLVQGPPGIVPCFEIKLHSCVLKARPEINSVVHVHPEFATLLSVWAAKDPLVPLTNQGSRIVLDPIPVYMKQKIVITDSEGTEMTKMLGQGDAVLLYGHGAATVGTSMERSIMNMLSLEHEAKMNYYARSMYGPKHDRVSRELVLEGTMGGPPLEEPHFQASLKVSGRPNYQGSWAVWYEMAEAELNRS